MVWDKKTRQASKIIHGPVNDRLGREKQELSRAMHLEICSKKNSFSSELVCKACIPVLLTSCLKNARSATQHNKVSMSIIDA